MTTMTGFLILIVGFSAGFVSGCWWAGAHRKKGIEDSVREWEEVTRRGRG